MLSGIMFPTDMLPSFLKNIGVLFPATWTFEAMYLTDNFELIKVIPLLLIILISLFITIFKIKNNQKTQ